MSKEIPSLIPLATLRRRPGFHAVGLFGPHGYASQPLVQPGPTGPMVAFFLGAGEPLGGGEEPRRLRLGAPTHVARYDAASGTFDALRLAAREELGLSEDTPAFLGDVSYHPEDPFLPLGESTERFLALCDLLAPVYASGARVTWETAERASEMLALFDEALEAPLLPCYRAVGAHFLSWAKRVSADAWWRR